jgi:phospholipase C
MADPDDLEEHTEAIAAALGNGAGRVRNLNRRELIAAITTVGAAAALGIPDATAAAARRAARRAGPLTSDQGTISPAHGDLGAIDHIVFLMMENRSYDHYFGAYHRGRGFDHHPKGSLGRFAQDYAGGAKLSPPNKLLPFRLRAPLSQDCTNDLTHDWGPQHLSWNNGRMDRWVATHTSDSYEGDPDGAMTMGYFTRKELPYHWALADHYTLCDSYHASVLGPTHPNRLMANSGTMDPAGTHGGPITNTTIGPLWSCTWTTIQEILQDKGVPWKVYQPSNHGVSGKYARLANYPTWSPLIYDPVANPSTLAISDQVLPYFAAFKNPKTQLHKRAFTPTFPNDFQADVRSGKLPSVSWIIPPLGFDEHPSSAPERGMWFVQQVLNELQSNRKVWAKTALFVMYDENDGWFDHVSPPTAPAGTPGEYLTAATISPETNGIRGPIGLGVRVPMLVISPFSRGGHLSDHLFDHTSQLQLISQRFDVELPNVSAWRRKLVGDLTTALFRHGRDMSMPALPKMTLPVNDISTGVCTEQDYQQGGAAPTIPTNQRMPTQHGTTVPGSQYFPPAPTQGDRVPATSARNTATVKSAANPLVHGGQVTTPAGAKR